MKQNFKRWLLRFVPLAILAGLFIVVLLVQPFHVYVVHTGSMAPALPLRSAVVVREGVYQIGQPISFTIHGETVTHRFVKYNRDGTLTTKGDANQTNDSWRLPRANVIGGVVLNPHDVGYLLMFLKNPEGLISVLLGIFVSTQILTAPTTKVVKLEPSVP